MVGFGERRNAKAMSKYEKHAWAVGIYIFLSAVLLAVFGYHPFWSVGFMFGCIILGTLFPGHRDFTETETRLAHKATAWTFYGVVVIAGIAIVLLTPEKEIRLPEVISRDVFVTHFFGVPLLFMGVRFIMLAYLLRKERLPHPVECSPDEWTYSPHHNLFPEGEEKNDHTP